LKLKNSKKRSQNGKNGFKTKLTFRTLDEVTGRVETESIEDFMEGTVAVFPSRTIFLDFLTGQERLSVEKYILEGLRRRALVAVSTGEVLIPLVGSPDDHIDLACPGLTFRRARFDKTGIRSLPKKDLIA
jgi:hypothetical protein